jgi:MFS family permease
MLAWFGLSIWAGLTIGPQIGVALLDHGYAAVWTFVAISPLVGGAIALSLRTGRAALADRVAFPSSLRELVPTAVIRPGVALMLGASGEGVLTAFIILHLADHGLGGSDPGAAGARVYTVFGIAVVVLRLVGGRITDSLGGSKSARIASGFEGAGLLLIGLAPSMAVVFTGAVATGAGFAVLFPALGLLAVDRSDERRRGATMGAFTGFYDVGFALGSTVGGLIATFAGYDGAFFYAAAAGLAINAVLGLPARRTAR